MKSNPQKYFTWLGYIVAILVITVGVMITAGLLVPAYIPDNFRYLFGIVFILYGVFRIVMLWTKSRQTKDYEQ